MFCNIIKEQVSLLISSMESATVLSISIGVIVVGITAIAIYTAFGPPSAQLEDPFEDHED
uniref:Protein PsbN n=1 Tax=Gloeothece verrucosa (strain PCC 7822) TaxID=497965 RepID=E0UFD2_GLOV7|nr:photosystem II protein PsbN [Gloeothece verrucosa PCC 7822]